MKTKTAKLTTFIFVLTVASIATLNAGAYVLNGNIWDGSHPRVPYYISDSLNGNIPNNGGSYQDAITAIQNAANEWNNSGLSELKLTYAGTTSVNAVADDGINAIIFDPGQCPYVGTYCKGATFYHETNGVFHGFDIVLYKYRGTDNLLLTWTAASSVHSWEVDVDSVVVHEFGHGLGLDHSQWAGKVMSTDCGTGCNRRTLRQDDKDGLHALYGNYTNEGLTSSTLTPLHGTSFTLSLNYPASAGKIYVVLLTLQGMTGYPLYNITPIDSRILPINVNFFDTSIYPTIFVNFVGYLDSNGNATATVNIPNNANLAGLKLDFSAATIDSGCVSGILDLGVGVEVTIQ